MEGRGEPSLVSTFAAPCFHVFHANRCRRVNTLLTRQTDAVKSNDCFPPPPPPPPCRKGKKSSTQLLCHCFSRSPFIRDFPLAFSFCFSSLFASEEKRKENRELRRFSREVLNLDWELLSILWRRGGGRGGRFRFVSHAIVGQVGELMMRV